MIHSLKNIQFLPISLSEAWKFFSSPENLKEITPAYMGFKIHTEIPPKIYAGMIISYTLKPIPGLRVNWVTEITHVKDLECIVDTQLSGSYSIWHHEHHFREVEGGIEMKDILYYKLPFGFIGRILNFLYIGSVVRSIFAYRSKVLTERFGV